MRRAVVLWLSWCCLILAFPEGRACDSTGETDSGGDNCSYYDEKPEFCGCCDTPAFMADRDCCACGQGLQGTAAWWTGVFHAWPRKAVSLHLEGKGLQGALPLSLSLLVKLKSLRLKGNDLTGTLPRELGDLSDLEHMDLSSNQLNGNLPTELGKLSKLRVLDLQNNRISGGLPAELGKLSQLQRLYLFNNQLSGGLPAELGNLSQLQKLSLRKNQLSGSLPAELGNLLQLDQLFLHENQLSGGLPAELGRLSRLYSLRLHTNQLSGSLPAWLGNLSQLVYLQLHANQFSGSIPAELGRLSRLKELRLHSNQLSGSIPAELGELSRLEKLYLRVNQLSGTVPAELGKLSLLITFYLGSNRLSGSLPAELGNMSRLKHFGIENNRISGSLPMEFGNLTYVEYLLLNNNEMTGSLPKELRKLYRLRWLTLSHNQLNGSLPELNPWGPFRLELAGNRLSGSLPVEQWWMPQLRYLSLSGNELSGSLPAALGQFSQLRELELQDNHFSGSLPAELGDLPDLTKLCLNNNQLSSSLPAELGKLSRLQRLHLHNNQLNGSLPAELGGLSQLQELYLDHNQLEGGIPSSYGALSRLEIFSAKDNPQFCGSTDAITELHHLRSLVLRSCCFETIASPPIGLEVLDLGGNKLQAVPESLRQNNLSVTTLRLDNNNISHWDTSSVLPLSWYVDLRCGVRPSSPRVQWPRLVHLDVSDNSFGPPVHDFLATLVHLPQLRVLRAANNRLSGGMPVLGLGAGFLENRPHSGNWDCSDQPVLGPVFPALHTLDLSRNHITHLLVPPPEQLLEVHLNGNWLTAAGLSTHWWQGGNALQLVSIQDNPALRLPIRLDADDSCAGSGVGMLTANARGWIPAAADAAGATRECTSLCQRLPRLLIDTSVQEEVLCRCSTGHGTGLNCTSCRDDAYSVQSFDNNTRRYQRQCFGCPLHSKLSGFAGQCFADCSCTAGYFMQQTSGGNTSDLATATCGLLLAVARLSGREEAEIQGNCTTCGIWKTSEPGSRKMADCYCNQDTSKGGWSGLLQQGSECRCPDGQIINFALRRCERCNVAEICTNWTRSLRPPELKAGFWALPPPPEGSDGTYGNFSRHLIWRCDSEQACPGHGDFSCGLNRTGTACSLCQRGSFRAPSGACLQCPQSHSNSRLLLLGALMASMVLPLLTHGLVSVAGESSRSQVLALRSLRISLKQVLKFAQVLNVVSLFQVEWPGVVLSVFQVLRTFSFDITSWMGVACLDAQQQESVALELAARWTLPVVAAIVTAAAAVVARTCGVLCRRCSKRRLLGRLLDFRFLHVLRVLLFFLQLFYVSILKNAMLPLTCSPSPIGHYSMNMFPHIICFDPKHASFWPLALLGGVFTVLLIAGYPLFLLRIRRRLPELWQEQSFTHEDIAASTWWVFIFDDFRNDCRHFLLVLLCKDILLNLIPAVLPGLGMFQLLATAMISTIYAFRVYVALPFHDTSNTLLEACTSSAVAVLCVFSAGMGFQSEPEVLDISHYLEEGRSDPVYLQRAFTLACLQGISLLAPVSIIAFQAAVAFERTQRFVPGTLLPATEEQLEEWRQDCLEAQVSLPELDDVTLASLHRVMRTSGAARRSMSMRNRKSSSRMEQLEEEPLKPSQPMVEQPGREPEQSQSVAEQLGQEPLSQRALEQPGQEPVQPQQPTVERLSEEAVQPSQPMDEPQAAAPREDFESCPRRWTSL